MRRSAKRAWLVITVLLIGCCETTVAQTSSSGEEIPIERCDVLPVIVAKAAGTDMRFLLDTGATTILNLRSFASGTSKEIRIDSWHGSAATSAREVMLPELQLGSHKLHDLKLPAIDLSPIGKACGGHIDGILGVDLLDRMGITIDLQKKVAVFQPSGDDAKQEFAEMEKAMRPCDAAFNEGNAIELEQCFDPDIVLYTPFGEFRGRTPVMQYLSQHYLKFAPKLRFEMQPHDVRMFGDALWYTYDYSINFSGQHIVGHGMAMCRKQSGKWRILNMHNSLVESSLEAKP